MTKTYIAKNSKRQKVNVKKVMSDSDQTKELIKLSRQVNQLRRQPETKNIDYVAAGVSPSYDGLPAATVFHLTDIAQGDSRSQRIGSSVKPFFLTLKGSVYSTSVSLPSTVRVVLIKTKKNRFVPRVDGGGTTPADQYMFAYPGTQNSNWAPLDMDNKEHFTVLHDSMVEVGPLNAGNSNSLSTFKINVRLGGATSFDANGADGGAIYAVLNSTIPTASSPPNVYFVSRVYYKDS